MAVVAGSRLTVPCRKPSASGGWNGTPPSKASRLAPLPAPQESRQRRG